MFLVQLCMSYNVSARSIPIRCFPRCGEGRERHFGSSCFLATDCLQPKNSHFFLSFSSLQNRTWETGEIGLVTVGDVSILDSKTYSKMFCKTALLSKVPSRAQNTLEPLCSTPHRRH